MRKEMKQIYLENDKRPLIGKTIKDMSYLPTDENSKSLIITFTDDTYIYVEIFYDNDRHDDILENGCVIPIENIDGGAPGSVYGGEFHYYKFLQEQIRLGLVEENKEYSMRKVEEQKKRDEEREYQEYLRLKAKFEKSEE